MKRLLYLALGIAIGIAIVSPESFNSVTYNGIKEKAKQVFTIENGQRVVSAGRNFCDSVSPIFTEEEKVEVTEPEYSMYDY